VNTWGLQQIKAPEAWPYTTGRSIKIGVIDTGVDHTHPDIKDAIAGGVNLLQKGTPPTDDNGHGTHICGIIAANNTLGGMAGVAPHARLYPVKAFDADGSAFVSDIILGIEWCVRNKMDIINMSFGMKTRSKALLNAVGAAYQAGIPIIASSGNDAKPRTIDYPARYQQTISVGATNRYHQVAHFCNRGPYINIYAPGERIVSTWLNGAYHEMNGTSMATAHVTGAVALMLAFHPNLSIAEIKQILQESMSPLRGVRNGMQPYFVGELNIPLMMQALRGRYPKSSAD
jgi:subtilisin family serine protease